MNNLKARLIGLNKKEFFRKILRLFFSLKNEKNYRIGLGSWESSAGYDEFTPRVEFSMIRLELLGFQIKILKFGDSTHFRLPILTRTLS